MTDAVLPSLSVVESAGVRLLVDHGLRDLHGIVVAFSMRHGGVSAPPYGPLNLAAHVGDVAVAVDENRLRLLRALDLERLRDRLVTAEQVHGQAVGVAEADWAGRGAFATGLGRPPVPTTDAMLTTVTELPLLLLFADCVPVVLVATAPTLGVAVVHAGWKGALARLPGLAAVELAQRAGCAPSDLLGYIGPHIGPCHYRVDAARLSQFTSAFGRIAAAQAGLDLGAVVSQSLSEVGVPVAHVADACVCTAERTDDFFSFRAEGTTGRHGALAVIL